ncbi:cullin-4B [Mytilinidion resinicola]|uniref:Cullin-4B n=1 Tax=Mytilinidion resinicola TaxID=574789 RepID=A0A6A6YJC2_9PEZI|nr:cullin-4B [Mytilinidion resinicola]KAF2808956.1 cullin-4B [Mytilinidion resinicola]
MYSFPTNNTVDLTKSPGNSPRKSAVRTNKQNFNPHLGARKLVVKNFRPQAKTDPTIYLNQVWEKLDKALAVVFKSGKLDFSLEELYRGVENLCRQGHAQEVCNRLEKISEKYVAEGLRGPLLEKLGNKSVDLLRATLAAWTTWNEQLKYVYWIFCYMDRSYLLQQSKSLQEMAISMFRNIVFQDPQLNPRIVDGACDLISADRVGENLDRQLFSETIKMFHEMQVYTTSFEPRMLELSQSFVAEWAVRESADQSLPEYVESSVRLIRSEMERVEIFSLDSTTRRDLLTLLEEHLIEKRKDRLVNQDDVADLLDENRVQSLEQLYTLLERRRLGSSLRPSFEKWIDDTGTGIVFDDKEQDDMVVKLLCLKRQLDTIWKVSFHRDEQLGHALRECFEAFMNKTKKTSATWNTDNSKPGEMIAKYVDMLLRGGAKAIPAQLSSIASKAVTVAEDDNEDIIFDEDTEINNQLDQVLDLFRFVHGKAVFEAFYKKDLARRLLMGRSASADAERSMLAKLKTECGSSFTANLEQMFKDVELAREEMASYKSRMAERSEKQSVDLSVNILSAAAWPTFPDIKVIIPIDIKNAIDKFEVHYESKHKGRKLDWKHALAHCQIKAKFPKGNKELVVSSFQAIVLLLFNDLGVDEKLSYQHLKEATGLPPAELARTLQSLACAKLRPITKHPRGRDINPTDQFSLNANFNDAKYRIKINTVQLKETKEENKATHERVAEDRNFETQAAIVRIMKSRKTITHAELVAETIKVTKNRGTLDMAGIKRNIDRLIEKDYMERGNSGAYNYVA